jgi:hypothetical protein
MILFCSGLARLHLSTGLASKAARVLVVGSCLFFTLFNTLDGIRAVEELGRDGLGFNHSGWRESPALRTLQSMPFRVLYSNRPTAIYLLTGRTSYIIPTRTDPVTLQPRTDYPSELETMRSQIAKGVAILVLFRETEDEGGWYDLTEGLPMLADYGDASLYGSP